MSACGPAAITLTYSVKDIQHDVRQIIIIYHEKSQLNRLVRGSLTLVPINFIKSPKKWSGQNRTSQTGSYAYVSTFNSPRVYYRTLSYKKRISGRRNYGR